MSSTRRTGAGRTRKVVATVVVAAIFLLVGVALRADRDSLWFVLAAGALGSIGASIVFLLAGELIGARGDERALLAAVEEVRPVLAHARQTLERGREDAAEQARLTADLREAATSIASIAVIAESLREPAKVPGGRLVLGCHLGRRGVSCALARRRAARVGRDVPRQAAGVSGRVSGRRRRSRPAGATPPPAR